MRRTPTGSIVPAPLGLRCCNGNVLLASQANNEGAIRVAIIEVGLVEGVIAMPDRLICSTNIPANLWIAGKGPRLFDAFRGDKLVYAIFFIAVTNFG